MLVGAVVLVAGALGTLAFRSPGYAGSSVSAAPRSVWVTNSSQFLLGRINRQIDELDSAAVVSSGGFDVLQEGSTVIAVDRAAHQLRVVDPATVALSKPLKIPDDAAVALGGGVLAVADRRSGKVWVLSAAQLTALAGTDLTAGTPELATGPGTVVAVAADGTVAATAPGAQSVVAAAPRWAANVAGNPTGNATRSGPAPATGTDPPSGRSGSAGPGPAEGVITVPLDRQLSLASVSVPVPVSLAMVGDTPVVLDLGAGRILLRGKDFPLPQNSVGATLQQTGPSSDAVLVATNSALLRLSLTDGTVQTFVPGTTGTPASPVWLGGCAHAAWAGSTPTYLAWCGSVPQIRPLPQSDATDPLVFRVNGPEIVLNDSVSGAVWTLGANLAVINDWSQVSPVNSSDTSKTPDSGNEQQSQQATLSRTDCSKGITPPTAVDDTVGVRAGWPTVVPVMANDATTDCSVVVIDKVSGWTPDTGTVQIADNGRALQLTTVAGATGALPPLTYEITDGNGHSSSATVSVSVIPADAHPAPRRIRDSATMVGPNGTVSDDVLADWESPAGDPLWLTAVEADGQDLAVGFQASGSITVHDTGVAGPGKRTVTFALTDGTTVEHGVLIVDVVSAADALPVASPVYATGVAGIPVVIDPLAAVTSPGADSARLASVTPPTARGGLTVTPDLDAGTVSFTASAPGSYQMSYAVVAGAASATGVIRVVITAAGGTDAPIAVTDTAFLPLSGQVRVDLTANDEDPSGGVLAVTQVSVPATAPLVVTLSDMHIAQISARRSLPPGGVWFSYQVSDGGTPVTGWVHVVSVPVPAGEGPAASDARMTVRAGDAATLQVADVALDRDGNAMTVQPFPSLPSGQGLLFAAGQEIRYLAPATPPAAPITTTYTVVDSAGRSDTASLTITVVPRGGNHAPRTPPVAVARVFAGATVTIALPLGGIDPDGDWVTVGGIDDPGRLGSVAVSGPDSISYQALDASGTDTVTYTAVDPFGASVVGRIDVVVVPLPGVAEPPVAPDLKASVAPGGTIGVDVLGAVSDPAGLAVRFASGTPSVPANAGVTAMVVDGVLAVTAGPQQTVVPITYTVVNSRGLSASGVVTVTVTPDATPMPPTASDVWVTNGMLSADRASVVVDVSSAVTNPSGRVADLTVSLPAGPSTAAVRGQTVTVPLTGSRQVVAYQVRNLAGLTADAFIVVPDRSTLAPADNTRPATTSTATSVAPPFTPKATRQLTADAGTTVTIVVADYVGGAAPGHTVTVPAGAALSASPGTLRRLDAGRVQWIVPATAGGAAVVRLQVTDGTSAPVTVTIPATVTPRQLPAPRFDSTAVSVAAGTTATVSLASLVTPGGPGQPLTYAGPTGQASGVTGSLAGSTLSVRARADTPRGTTVALGVTVSDGVHPAVPSSITVTVTGSNAPLATVPGVTVTDGVQGRPLTLNVLAGATNPLPSAGPLRVISPVQVLQGQATATISGGSSLIVTPGATQVGVVTVQFTVADATGDPNRYVTGTATVTVRGKPNQVPTPAVISVGDRSAVLKWSIPSANGATITGYTVAAQGYQHSCPASPCTLTGLTNNVSYRFTVVAHNAVGDSVPSPSSAAARPDVAPAAPAAPTVVFGDQAVTVSWKAPTDNGSPITGYLLTIAPKPSSGAATVRVTGTSATVKNLVNGTSYTATVVAQNSSGTDSPASPASDPVIPAGVPATPAAPTLTFQQGQGGGSGIGVAWTAPDGNGDDNLGYLVRWTGSDGTHGTVAVTPGGAPAATITPVTLGVSYSVTVTATNKAGSSTASAASTIVPFTAPDPPSGVQAQATGQNGTVSLSWSAAKTHGAAVTQYRYSSDSGSTWKSAGTSLSVRVGGLTNGTRYQFTVQACTGPNFDICSGASDSVEVIPYGPIAEPAVSASLSGSGSTYTATFSWSPPADNGLAPYTYRVTGSVTTTTSGTSVTASVACGGNTATVSVTAIDKAGHASGPGRATTSGSPPCYVIGTVGDAGAPTFESWQNMATGDPGQPRLNGGYQAGISCWVNTHGAVIPTDGNDGWLQIAPGYQGAGRQTPANNFRNWQQIESQVPQC
jgi:hypothetical protein